MVRMQFWGKKKEIAEVLLTLDSSVRSSLDIIASVRPPFDDLDVGSGSNQPAMYNMYVLFIHVVE